MKTNLMTILGTTMVATACSAGPVKNERGPATEPKILTFASDANGFDTKNFFYDNGQEVVVFDTQFTPELARKSLEAIRAKTRNPITYVVVTHPNPDKFNGMSVFQAEGAKVVMSRATAESLEGVHAYKKYFFVNIAKMFTEETYPKLGKADLVFEKDLDLELANGETIRLQELASPGVSSNQTVALVSRMNALMVGDLVHHKAHAWLEGGIVAGKTQPTIRGWIGDLRELEQRFGRTNPTVFGGRGESAKLGDAVKAQVSYLEKADRLVERYVKSLGARATELSGEKAGEHHKAIQTQMEKAFPDYGLGYMIQYGVYGLVNSKL